MRIHVFPVCEDVGLIILYNILYMSLLLFFVYMKLFEVEEAEVRNSLSEPWYVYPSEMNASILFTFYFYKLD